MREEISNEIMRKSAKQRIVISIILLSVVFLTSCLILGNPETWTETQRVIVTIWLTVVCVASFTDFKD